MHKYLLAIITVGFTPIFAGPIGFNTNLLVSDIPGAAALTDPGLINAWGLTASSSSPFWLSANGTGTSDLYNGAGAKQALVVTIPGVGGNPGSPTGVVFNGTTNFNSDLFIFASEDGTIAGWRGALGTTAETLIDSSSSGSVFKGIATGTTLQGTYLYAADFHNGVIDVVPGTGAPALTGTFTDKSLPAGYAPFNVQNIGGVLYVTYAKQDAAGHDDVPGAGNGFVDAFDLNGNFVARVVSGGALDSPWGLAIAPAGFGDVGGDLLVGNFGDGKINAYTLAGVFVETLVDGNGNPITIDGLWGLDFGNGAASGSTNTLYFTAGPDGETHGLFGDLVTAPEPGTWALAGLCLAGIAFGRWWASAAPKGRVVKWAESK
jgi:uncharacterized protein (TIGR03118 family)